jgi:hypothetical protein
MDWKGIYRREIESPEGRFLLSELIEDYRRGEPTLRGTLEKGGVVSFPHTALAYSAPIIMRTVTSLLGIPGLQAVIALGVIHVGALPESHRALYLLAHDRKAPPKERLAAWERLAGGFVPATRAIATPFGDLEVLEISPSGLIREDDGILRNEFSLDSFTALYRLAASELGVRPPPLLPVYVGITRNPVEGTFEVAQRLAAELGGLAGPKVALVTTGDVVHYGLPYGDKPMEDRLPKDITTLTAHFRSRFEEVTLAALKRRDYGYAFLSSERELKSDQRYILPLISELLGAGAEFDILSFELSDYSGIFDVPPPCVVASALVAYSRGRP